MGGRTAVGQRWLEVVTGHGRRRAASTSIAIPGQVRFSGTGASVDVAVFRLQRREGTKVDVKSKRILFAQIGRSRNIKTVELGSRAIPRLSMPGDQMEAAQLNCRNTFLDLTIGFACRGR